MSAERGRRAGTWLAVGSIVGLVAGLLVGSVAHWIGIPRLTESIAALDVVSTLWGNALRMVVVPLVVAQLIVTLTAPQSASVGRVGGFAAVTFVTMLVLGGMITVAVMPAILGQLSLSDEALLAFRTAVVDGPAPPVSSGGFTAWLIGLVPTNPLRAVVQDNLVGVLLFTLAFGAAVSTLPAERRRDISDLAHVVADAMMIIVGWLMWVMPIAAFAMALSTAALGGFGTLQVVALFVVLVCAVMVVWTLLLYPLAAMLGGVSIVRFARAVFPVQIVAVSTRSSIASLPSLIDCARNRLGLRPDVVSLVMPLAVSTFKVNYPVSSPVQFMFVAYLYGVPLSATTLVAFVLGIVVLSFASVGIPNGGALMRAAPFYVAAGVPMEGYLLTEAVESIPDIFKTVMNVTGDMTAACIVNRMSSEPVTAAAAHASGVGVVGVSDGA